MSKHVPELFLLNTEKIIYVLLTFRTNELSHAKKIELIVEIEDTLKNKFANRFPITLVWSSGNGKSEIKIWSENTTEQTLPYHEIKQFFKDSKLETYLMPDKLAKRVNLGDFLVFPNKEYVEHSLRLIKNTPHR